MIVSTNPPFLFVHIPKTAGTSIENALFEFQEFEYRTSPHMCAKQYKDYFIPEIYNQFFKFAIVRNPYDLLFSTWKFFVKNSGITMNFKEWILWRYRREPIMSKLDSFDEGSNFTEKEKMSRLATAFYVNKAPQVMFLIDDNGDMLIDYIGRFENVDEDFKEIVNHLGLEDIHLPHSNKSGLEFVSNDYRKFYDDETRELVRINHLFDLEFFGYEYEDNNPKTNFGFVNYKNLSDTNLEFPEYMFFNLGNLIYGHYDIIERNKFSKEELDHHLKYFQKTKIRAKVTNYEYQAKKFTQKIKDGEEKLYSCDDDSQIYNLQKEILGFKEQEIFFFTKAKKLKRTLDSMGGDD